MKIIFYVNGIGNKQYVEYKELTEARESSEKALRKANTSIKLNIISIVIAILALGITAYYSHKAYYKPDPLYPVPPYEVKINQPVKINDESINKIRVLTKDSVQ